MGHLREQSIVRIDKEDGPAPSNFESRKLVGWDLFTHRTLIYVSPNRNDFEEWFTKTHPSFKVFLKQTTRHIQAGVGRYYGRTEKFSGLNYLHQRHALLGSFGQLEEDSLKAGVQGHRVRWGNVINVGLQAAQWITNPVGTLAEKVTKGKPKYFVAFADRDVSRVVHMQEAILWCVIGDHGKNGNQELTLGEFWNQYGDQVEGFLHKLGGD